MAINKLYIGDDTKENITGSESDSNSQSSDRPIIRNENEELQSWSYRNISIEPILFGLFFAVSLSGKFEFFSIVFSFIKSKIKFRQLTYFQMPLELT